LLTPKALSLATAQLYFEGTILPNWVELRSAIFRPLQYKKNINGHGLLALR